jgi:hypothetical protein
MVVIFAPLALTQLGEPGPPSSVSLLSAQFYRAMLLGGGSTGDMSMSTLIEIPSREASEWCKVARFLSQSSSGQ